MPVIHGGARILNSGSTAVTGDWYDIPHDYGNPAWQAVLTNSSVGATAATSVYIEVANSTAAYAVRVHSIALTCTTDTVSTGGTLAGSTYDGAWRKIRAVSSLTTSTAGSSGTPNVAVYCNLQKLG